MSVPTVSHAFPLLAIYQMTTVGSPKFANNLFFTIECRDYIVVKTSKTVRESEEKLRVISNTKLDQEIEW